jgi:hypothetical protein
MRGGFANTDKQDTLVVCECSEKEIWCENIPTVAPFTQTGAMESMRAGYCNETSDGRIHPFETDRAGRQLVDSRIRKSLSGEVICVNSQRFNTNDVACLWLRRSKLLCI